jgi:hypothetical protein
VADVVTAGVPAEPQPDFDSAALFARGDTGACVSLLAVGVGVAAVLEVPVERDDDSQLSRKAPTVSSGTSSR